MSLVRHSTLVRKYRRVHPSTTKLSITNHRIIRQITTLPTRRLIIRLHLSLAITRTTNTSMLLCVEITNTIRHGVTSMPRHVRRHNVPIFNIPSRTTHPFGGSNTQLLIRNVTRPIRQIKLRHLVMRRRIQPIGTRVMRHAMQLSLLLRHFQRLNRGVHTGTTIYVNQERGGSPSWAFVRNRCAEGHLILLPFQILF